MAFVFNPLSGTFDIAGGGGSGGSGDVVGPSSAVDSQIALFSTTTGKLLKASSATGLPVLNSGVITPLALTSSGDEGKPICTNGAGGVQQGATRIRAGFDINAATFLVDDSVSQGVWFAVPGGGQNAIVSGGGALSVRLQSTNEPVRFYDTLIYTFARRQYGSGTEIMEFVLSPVNTTDATATAIFNYDISLWPQNNTNFTLTLTAIDSTGVYHLKQKRELFLTNSNGTVAIAINDTVGTDVLPSGWVGLTASVSGTILTISVTGAASTNAHWVLQALGMATQGIF